MNAAPQTHAEMQFELSYQGPALEEGRMSARELGPALISVAQVLERSSQILYGEKGALQVDVRGNFRRGSFGVEFVAASGAADLLQGLSLKELAALSAIVGLSLEGAKTLIGVVRWIAGRKVEKIEERGDEVVLRIRGDEITISLKLYQLLDDETVRKGLQGLVEPLKEPGVEALEISEGGQPATRITREEAKSFNAPIGKESAEVSMDESTAVVEVVAPTFRQDNKWRLAQGDTSFHAAMLDEEFLGLVDRHEVVFGKGDALRVRMVTYTRRENNEYRYEREITRVIERIPAARSEQMGLMDE